MPPMKRIPCGQSCYVCHHSSGSYSGKGLYYHCIPRKLKSQPTRDKWLEFLHLPSSSHWPNKFYEKITLCSLHFKKSDYPPNYKDYFRVKLIEGTVPSKNRPDGPGTLGELFTVKFLETCGAGLSPDAGEENDHDSPLGSPDTPEDHFPEGDTYDDSNELDSFVDSAALDHDYIATTVPRKSQTSGFIRTAPFCKEKQDDLIAKQQTLENLRRELCRLCGQKGSVMTPIFEPALDTSESMPVSSKIDVYLPIKVKLDDSLPFCICSNCLSVLNHWHELYTTCVAADAVLSKTFGKESSMIPVNNPCASDVLCDAETQTEMMAPKPFTVDTPSDPLTAEMISEPHTVEIASDPHTVEMASDPLIDEMRENEDVCTHCGESKTGTVKEDKLFEEEFDKSFRTYRNISYKCRFCYELFKNSADRKSHIAVCHQLSTICELCGYNVPCRKDLKRHKYGKHVVVPPKYLCDKCDRFFKSAKGLDYHLENIHGVETSSGKYCCELCGSVFLREVHFRIHQRKHEKGKIKTVFQIEDFRQEVNSEGSENLVVYSCPVCQKIFSDKLSLAVHVTEKKKIQCSLCHKILPCEKRVFLHVCGQWTCQYCLKSFDQRVKWLVHERLHTGEKPIKCRRCECAFRTWQARRHHEMVVHEPSFRCTYCEKSFKNKYVFQDHVARHEGKEFSCHICNKTFSGRKNLRKHISGYHKELEKAVCISE